MSIHLQKHHKVTHDHFPEWLEAFIIFAIIAVVGVTIVEDVAIMKHWDIRSLFIITAITFGFDVFFSLEFTARAVITSRRGEFRKYFLGERGWIDLLSSFPLMLLISGPALLFYLLNDPDSEAAAFGFLSVLKTAKAIRVTRILRLIRILKIFGKIQNTDSVMTNRHVATIASTNVVALVVVLVITAYFPFFHFGDHNAFLEKRQTEMSAVFNSDAESVQAHDIHTEKRWLLKYLDNPQNDDVIWVRDSKGEIFYEAPEREQLLWTKYREDIDIGGGYTARLSFWPAEAEHAKQNLFVLLIIIALILAMMFIYTGIFARQVADPIFIMDKGLRHWEYNLEVKLSDYYMSDEIFQLAKAYNTRWLPLKTQIRSYRKEKESEKSVLSVDDLF